MEAAEGMEAVKWPLIYGLIAFLAWVIYGVTVIRPGSKTARRKRARKLFFAWLKTARLDGEDDESRIAAIASSVITENDEKRLIEAINDHAKDLHEERTGKPEYGKLLAQFYSGWSE